MKIYKKSKLGLFLKILGSILGIVTIIIAIYLFIKVSSFTNEFEMMIGRIMVLYSIAALIASMITSGTLWGIAITLDNQIRIESKLEGIYKVLELQNQKEHETQEVKVKNN